MSEPGRESPHTRARIRGLPHLRWWLACGLGALAVIAIAAGITMVVTPSAPQPGGGQPAVAAPWPAPPTSHPASVQPADKPAPAPPTVPAQRPGTVRLPDGATARLVRKEVTADGTLPILNGVDEATWSGAKLGGASGAAVFSGHVNWNGVTGPFAQLWRIAAGNTVSVVNTSGGQWIYRVTDVLTLHKNELPTQAQPLLGQDGPHRLVLVTCGDYIAGTDGYRDNRIVTAELVAQP